MTQSTERLRRAAKALRKAFAAGNPDAVARVRAVLPDADELKHTGALHVIAREDGHASWPRLKFAHEMAAMARDEKVRRLEIALHFGQHWVVEALLTETPDLGRDDLGLACALYDIDHVRSILARDPEAATRAIRNRRPLLHLAFSQHLHAGGDRSAMMQIAEALLAAGADVNDSYPYQGDPNVPLSALYGALGHAHNLQLAEWLLDHGADPNDGESLYHATELGQTEGLRLLLSHGARPEGTNALPRALDSNDHAMVRLLLTAGADPNEGIALPPSGEAPFVIPALPQAARRLCDGAMIDLLLEAGADPSERWQGISPYAMARVYGNAAAARRIAEVGGDTALTPAEALLAAAADDTVPEGQFVDPRRLPEEFRTLPRSLMQLPDRLPHIRRLIALGLEPDRPDAMDLTPVQVAGWEGLPDAMAFFLSLGPDLDHVNGYGGDLLSTVVHGSENCPARAERDHVACARLALEAGRPLPRRVIDFAGDPDMAGFLADWAEAHPDRVDEADR
ncbi:ankyrin repeat domain-containing protein [Psychromarinibacter sp. C21-152]|uniref:Ankyrin repeat domain-containing protein n=1 Tax=Psychromarinibacter sediminicola TaxID=3033385 RepID=A0AAE3NNU7_9RHOB|nr:ankyrin repeat domain-containing protein [Psychromarinibacter sediminicola]MDF0600763.1 ankyrin repeat domain-containing protein [Psychromarinibacter sediminicola]